MTTRVARGLVETPHGYIHYRSFGQGPTIVLNHMSARSSRMWLDTMHRIGSHVRVVAVDLPGFGDSDPVAGPFTMDLAVDSVLAVCDALELRDIVVGGLAMGAYVSVEMTARRPDLVAGTVLVSCPYYPYPEYATYRHVIAKAGYPVDSTGYPLLRTIEQTREMDPAHAPLTITRAWIDEVNRDLFAAGRTFWDGMPIVAGYPLAERLRTIASPVLMLWGKDFLYAKSRDGIVDNVRNGEVHLIPNAGIFPDIDNPGEFDRELVEFVARVSPASPSA